MYIKKSLILSLFLCFIVSSVYASNTNRKVYGVLAESVSGVHFDAASTDDDSIHFYPWSNTIVSGTPTGVAPEGITYSRLVWKGQSAGWVGCGWTSTNSAGHHDMSLYYNGQVKFLVRSSNSKVKNCKVGFELKAGKQVVKSLESLNFNTNGQWQEITINLNTDTDENITSENLSEVALLFMVSQNTDVENDNILDIDYIRWIRPNNISGSFNVTLKNISNNSVVNTENITWAASDFQTGWKVAEQYLEIDYDKDSSTNDWKVKLYVDNGSTEKNGLYATKAGKDYILPMCWRASDKNLPYTDNNGSHTLQIGEKYNSTGKYYYLYDSGSASTEYSPWLYMQDLTALTTDKDKDYSTVMGYKTGGYHAYSGVYGSTTGNGYYSGSKVSLYLGANCGNAAGGLKYQGNIVVALEYE
ncbi:MAG: hypothetical protein K5622_04465 [Endomicrobiaceae bacterium]|nr:hypothetical protein [Endomicrobiaceae bacterium]